VVHIKQRACHYNLRYVYYANILILPTTDIATILGLDWLEENGVLIDCSEKTVSLRGSNEDGLFIKEIHTPRLR
jgi:hypothetical protein